VNQQQAVQAELERVQQLRAGLESGDIDPEQATSELAGLAAAKKAGLSPDAMIPVSASKSRAGKTVGQPASVKKGPAPGDAHIAVGTVGRAVLDQDVMSDYPGTWRGLIIDDIYDIEKRFIVIPKGTRLVGHAVRIQNINEPINARMGLLIEWFVLPDGSKISLDRSSALDAAGIAAIKDKVNRHLVAQVMGVAAYAIVSSETSREGTGYMNDTTFEGDVGEGLRKQFAPLAQKYLNLVPTITLRSGTPIRVFIEDDIYAQPWGVVNEELIRRAAR
jgi:type IV secretion system protein VirB10